MKVNQPKNMARKKKEEEVVEEVQEEIQDEALEDTVEEETAKADPVTQNPDGTPAYTKAQFKELIEAYKVQNPKKYEQKKEALEAQLKALK